MPRVQSVLTKDEIIRIRELIAEGIANMLVEKATVGQKSAIDKQAEQRYSATTKPEEGCAEI